MSAKNLRPLSKYIPLWQRNIPEYPLYRKGNPQTRVFLPLFWMRLIKHDVDLPPNQVCFEVHHQMTKYDVKNYLEKIYNVPVLSVTTAFVPGKERKHLMKGTKLSPGPDGRRAFVTLKNEKFEFPDFYQTDKSEATKEEEMHEEQLKETKQNSRKNWNKKDLPVWFRH